MDPTARLKLLFERFLNNDCSEEEVEELLSSLRKGPVSKALEPLLEDVWRKLADYPSLNLHHRDQLLGKISVRMVEEKSKRRWLLPLKIAATLALLLVVVRIINMPGLKPLADGKSINYITKSTQVGQRALYTLPDGSVVNLNAGSSLTFPEKFAAFQRVVKLDGEAFFEVTEQHDRPFIVESSGIKTRVLGTSFNVRAYKGQDIEVTVLTGKVQVESSDKSSPEQDTAILLTPHQQAIYSQKNKDFTHTPVDVRKYLAWYTKELIFENTPMRDVIVMLEKRFDQKVMLENREMGSCTIRKARYERESLETILKGLQTVLEFDYEFDRYNQWTIQGKGCH